MYDLTVNISTTFLLALSIWQLFLYIQDHVHRSSLTRNQNCQPPTIAQSTLPFGLDQFTLFPRRRLQHSVLEKDVQKYGNTFRSTPLPFQDQVFTIEPANIHAAWRSENFGVAPLRQFPMLPLCGVSSRSSDGETWSHSLSLLEPTFDRAQATASKTLERHLRELFAQVPGEGKTFDIAPLLKQMELDYMSDFIFGPSPEAQAISGHERRKFYADFKRVMKGVDYRARMPIQREFLHKNTEFLVACSSVHAFVDEVVSKAIARQRLDPFGSAESADEKKSRSVVLVDDLIAKTDDLLEIKKEMISVFLSAQDTFSKVVSACVAHLSRDSNLWTRLRTEVTSIFGTVEPIAQEKADSHQLPLLYAIINESLRLNSPITTMERVALSDSVLPVGGGAHQTSPILIHRGDRIMTNLKLLHRRKDFFGEDADQFRPDRWLEKHSVDSVQILTFGSGLRACPAKHLVTRDLAYTLARFAQEWESLDWRDGSAEYTKQSEDAVIDTGSVRVAANMATSAAH